MSDLRVYVGIPASAALAYILVLPQQFAPYVWTGVIAAIWLMWIGKKKAPFVGFAIGTAVLLSTYLFYPLNNVSSFSGTLSSITSMPAPVLILIYPLIYGVVMGLGALLWSGVNEYIENEITRRRGNAGQ